MPVSTTGWSSARAAYNAAEYPVGPQTPISILLRVLHFHSMTWFESEGMDAESLLVAFLSELVYYHEQENLAFDTFNIQMSAEKISASMEGGEITSVDKAIKAVTFHGLEIEETERGVEATIVFDV
jgi:SHS2 domain-containing protein